MGFITSREQPTAGLLAMCIAIFALSHWFGALLHLFPWGELETSDDRTDRGFALTAIGVLSLWIGARFIAPLADTAVHREISRSGSPEVLKIFAKRYAIVGLVLIGIVFPVLGGLPTVAALASSGMYIVLAGICLYAWEYARAMENRKLLALLASLLVVPIVTLALTENVIRAVAAIMLVLVFTARIYRPRWQAAIAMLILVYAGLSFGVTYLQQRGELRELLREEEVAGKFLRSIEMVTEYEFLSPVNQDQLRSIDARMNQNWLVGAAIENYSDGGAEFLHGETLYMALAALVPRAIWPDKDVFAGGMNLAGEMTGLNFAESTSVGMGPVLELYANFGEIGVILGMLLIGILLGVLDRGAYWALKEARFSIFCLYFVMGLGLLRAEGSFVETSVTFVSNWFIVWVVNKFIFRTTVRAAGNSPHLKRRDATA